MLHDADRDLSREIAKAIGPIVQKELASWRWHMRTMSQASEDGLLPEQSCFTVSSTITREVSDYLAVWLKGRGSA